MKERIDVCLVRQGFFETREKAKRALMAGLVFVNGQRIEKPGMVIDDTLEITVKGVAIPYVSRGGLKLEKAIKKFGIQLEQSICMDVGASTGGFTDCMLQHGASKVYAVDVGYGQLDWKLRSDERVINLERTNVRYLTNEQVPEPLAFLSIDVAFISLKLVLPVVKTFLNEAGEAVMLIKPQFEAGREQVGKKGVVRDASVHQKVIEEIINFSAALGFSLYHLDFSPITGPNGNIEFLAHVGNQTKPDMIAHDDYCQCAAEIVAKAHETLKS